METVSLHGTWKLSRKDRGTSYPIAIPGDIVSALYAAGEIPDPYYDRNELGLQWIGKEDWELATTFQATEALLGKKRVYLEIETLDTVAELCLNGMSIGTSANMFRRLRIDVRENLRLGTNDLSIRIKSPAAAAAEIASTLRYPVPTTSFPVTSPHRNLIRKSQCMSGWDWGPCFINGGIYDSIRLVGVDAPRIEYARIRTIRNGKAWTVGLDLELDSIGDCQCEIRFEAAGKTISAERMIPAGSSRFSFTVDPGEVREWWPAGLGSQALYAYRVNVKSLAEGHVTGHEVSGRFGFRELEAISNEDAAGKSLLLRINGRDVFAKGANWIPADALPSRCTQERIGMLLDAAVSANMNCIRVWGGGRYESDAFYDLCDEKGIMVWQDFMFACSLYPSTPEFLSEVEEEVRHQVKRLSGHPCIALWCGNNENLGALNWYEESRSNPIRYIVDYDRLNEGVIGRLVRELDPDRLWWPSSPGAGKDEFGDNWHSDSRGDMHYWSVWHEGKPFSAYLDVKPRFCSEFGFQALPSLRTAKTFAPPGQLNPTSPAFEHHQRNNRGNTVILETMSRYFRMPSGFEKTLYLSQVQQAYAIRTAVEYWRSLMPQCMGTLYWQLNDTWPGASWSSLEYDGSPRLLHHEARRFYDQSLLSLILKDGEARLVIVEEGIVPYACDITVELRDLAGKILSSETLSAKVAGESALEVWKRNLDRLESGESRLNPEEVFLVAKMESRPRDGSAQVSRRIERFLTEPKRCELRDPRVTAKVTEKDGVCRVTLASEAPAFWVELDAEGFSGRFDDGGFNLLPGDVKTVAYIPAAEEKAAASAIEKALEIRHLFWSYRE